MDCVDSSRIDDVIVEKHFYDRPNGVITCLLQLQNGTTVSGESNDSREDAYLAARDKVWVLENYLLAQQLFSAAELKAGSVR